MEYRNEVFNESVLHNSEFAALLKHACCGICAYLVEDGKQPRMMYMTDGFSQICEGSKEDIFAAYQEERLFGVKEEYREQMNRMIADTIMSGEKHEMTYEALTLGGKAKWCSLVLSPDQRDENTTILFGTFFDVSNQMKYQEQLQDLVQNIPGAICLYYFDGKRLEPVIVSECYSNMLGEDAFEMLNQMTDMNFKHVHPDELEDVKKAVYHALTETYQLDYTYRSYHNIKEEYIWLNVQGKVSPRKDGTAYAYVIYTDITRDKKIEQKLRANQQILESATENTGVWYWNCHWREDIAYLGERFQQDFQMPEILHNFCDEMVKSYMIDDDYRAEFQSMCDKIVAGKKEGEAIVKGYFPDKTVHWMRFKMSNVFDEYGVAQEAVGVMHLVDDMKKMERKYEIEKRHTLENRDLLARCCINVSTWQVIDYAGIYTKNNQQVTVEDIKDNIANETVDTNIKNQLEQMHKREFLIEAFAEGKTEFVYEYQRMLSEEKCIWVSSSFHLMMDVNENELLLFEYCYDINVKKTMNILMEFAVNDDYDLMGFVNMNNKDSIMIYGKKSYNPHEDTIVEEDYDESLQKFANNAIVEENREEYLRLANLDYVTEYLETHESLEFYFNMIGKEGNIQSKKVCYLKYNGDDNCIIYIQSDITQIRLEQMKNQEALEEALEKAKVASRAKTTFLSQMSHEIRTPMNAIVGMAKLAKQTEDKDEMTEYLQQIDASSQYLLGIINDILDMSRIESGKLELHPRWCDGCRIVLDCIEMLKPAMDQKNITFLYPDIIKNSPIRFYVDPLRVQQIYMNLLNNAVKFTPKGGTIELTIKNLSYNEEEGRDHIQIRDTGCGMSQDFLKRIFQPFEMEENEFSSEVQGTGLGLALVKSYITAMGGDIRVESELGKGSTFIFDMPYKAKKVSTEEEKDTYGEKRNLNGKHILLVDDHALNRTIAKKLLEREGMTIAIAVNGMDACEKYEEAPVGTFDAILMDIRMPKMNGLEATKKIREMNKEDAKTIPIIAMTANAFDEDVQISLDAGMNAHLAKPIQPEVMYETLSHWMMESRSERWRT